MKARVLAAAAALAVCSHPALAMVDPPQSSSADGHMRTVVYDPNNPVEITATPGATFRLQFGADEVVLGVLASDQDTIAPIMVPAGSTSLMDEAQMAHKQGVASCDKDLCRSVVGNFVYLKPLKLLDPQPLFIQTARLNAGKIEMVPYTFELTTVPVSARPNVWAVTFAYPVRRRAAQVYAWRKRQAAEAAQVREAVVEARAPALTCSSITLNVRYFGRGSAELSPNRICDDGRETLVFYAGNRRIPNWGIQLPDKTESIPAYSTEPEANGTWLRIGTTARKWFVRDGKLAFCVFNQGSDPEGATVSTVTEPAALAGVAP